MENITSVKDIKVGDRIVSNANQHLGGVIVEIDQHFVIYKSLTTGLVQPIHVDNIGEYRKVSE